MVATKMKRHLDSDDIICTKGGVTENSVMLTHSSTMKQLWSALQVFFSFFLVLRVSALFAQCALPALARTAAICILFPTPNRYVQETTAALQKNKTKHNY